MPLFVNPLLTISPQHSDIEKTSGSWSEHEIDRFILGASESSWGSKE
jgi:hypothetical protein